jgi:two-component system alkaline phosphatase synthesis response regulator PhoP
LVVDDEKEFLELLRYRLNGERYEVMCATNGTEALEQSRQATPDLILMDLLLPDLDGLSVVEILRRQPGTRNTPIIMISSVTSDPTRRAAQVVGASAYLGKPLNFAALGELLDAFLLPPENLAGAPN